MKQTMKPFYNALKNKEYQLNCDSSAGTYELDGAVFREFYGWMKNIISVVSNRFVCSARSHLTMDILLES